MVALQRFNLKRFLLLHQ